MRLIGGASWLLLAAACVSCENTGESALRVEESAFGPAYVITGDTAWRAPDRDTKELIESWERRLTTALDSVVIGGQDGASAVEFGIISDLASDGEHIAVADLAAKDIKVLDGTGRIRWRIAEGGGPLEFGYAAAVVFAAGGELVVIGPGMAKIFQLYGDSIALRHTTMTGFPVYDACAIGSRVYLRGSTPQHSRIVRTLTLDGVVEREFGEGPPATNPYDRATKAKGRIACTEAPPRVVVSFDGSPYVVAYDTAGQRQWVARIEGFTVPASHSIERGGIVASASDRNRPEDVIRELIALPGGGVVVQVDRRDAGASYWSVEHYLLAATSGMGRRSGRSDMIVRAVDGQRRWYSFMAGAGYPTVVGVRY